MSTNTRGKPLNNSRKRKQTQHLQQSLFRQPGEEEENMKKHFLNSGVLGPKMCRNIWKPQETSLLASRMASSRASTVPPTCPWRHVTLLLHGHARQEFVAAAPPSPTTTAPASLSGTPVIRMPLTIDALKLADPVHKSSQCPPSAKRTGPHLSSSRSSMHIPVRGGLFFNSNLKYIDPLQKCLARVSKSCPPTGEG